MNHASVWMDTAESWLDLHLLLPWYYSSSEARSVEVIGSDVWVVGFATDALQSRSEALLWHYSTVPEPSSLLALGGGLLGLLKLKRKA